MVTLTIEPVPHPLIQLQQILSADDEMISDLPAATNYMLSHEFEFLLTN